MKEFIGRNIARFQFGKSYVLIFVTGITAISTTAVWLDIPTTWFFPLIGFGTILMFIVGYTIDKLGIYKADVSQKIKQNLDGAKYVNGIVWEEIIAPIEWKMLHKPIVDELQEIKNELIKLNREKELKI